MGNTFTLIDSKQLEAALANNEQISDPDRVLIATVGAVNADKSFSDVGSTIL